MWHQSRILVKIKLNSLSRVCIFKGCWMPGGSESQASKLYGQKNNKKKTKINSMVRNSDWTLALLQQKHRWCHCTTPTSSPSQLPNPRSQIHLIGRDRTHSCILAAREATTLHGGWTQHGNFPRSRKATKRMQDDHKYGKCPLQLQIPGDILTGLHPRRPEGFQGDSVKRRNWR